MSDRRVSVHDFNAIPSDHAMPAHTDSIGDLLDKLVLFLRTYIVMSAEQTAALALWIVHTHAIAVADTTPYLHVTAPTMRSGKTRVLEVLETLVRKPILAANASQAALFRSLTDEPTLLFDEIDALFGSGRKTPEREDQRALLNAGYRRGQNVLRCVGEGSKQRVVPFPVFGPKALSGIGALPSTLADRSLPLRLKRRTRSESISRWRQSAVPPSAALLRDAIAAWVEENDTALAAARPQLPDELDDRAQDAYEPLLAIAELAGGVWSERARKTLVALRSALVDEDEIAVQLLDHIRDVFKKSGHGDDDQREACNADAARRPRRPRGSAVVTWHRDGKPLSPSGLARLLRQFGIRPKTIRLSDTDTAKGYERDDFTDAWKRYTPQLPASQPSQPSQPSSHAGFDPFSQPSQDDSVTDAEIPANPYGYVDVTAVTGRSAGNGAGSLCGHAEQWLARDGSWRCTTCEPPVFAGEVVDTKSR